MREWYIWKLFINLKKMKFKEEDLSEPEIQYLSKVLEIIAKVTNVPINFLKAYTRNKEIVALTRQLYFYLANNHKPFTISFSKIGAPVDRDHATVMHGIKTIKNHISVGDKLVIGYLYEFDKSIALTEFKIASDITLKILTDYTAALLSHDGAKTNPKLVARVAREYMLETIKVHTQKEKYGIE